jgi:hypothetical protein
LWGKKHKSLLKKQQQQHDDVQTNKSIFLSQKVSNKQGIEESELLPLQLGFVLFCFVCCEEMERATAVLTLAINFYATKQTDQ